MSIDYNNLFKLPLTFYRLSKLKILRLEGNENQGSASRCHVPGSCCLSLSEEKIHG